MAIYLPIVTQFNSKGLKQAEKGFKDLEGAQAKAKYALGKANKYAAVALGGLVAGLGDAVKGAMEDEQAQTLLARQLQKTTGATDAQVKSVEAYITKQGQLKGVTDDELRPALAGLVRATKDIGEAQKATNLAMDVAAAKGLSLETVTKAMEKAYGGNMGALAKLSPELKQMIKDGASMEEVMSAMADTFGGAATDSANTAAGSMKRLGVALGEAKEGVGAALLPVLEKALPVLQKFAVWAQDNPTLITAVAVAFGALAASIVLVNAAMALNPVVLITAGIVALGVALVMAYKKFDTFRSIVDAVFEAIKTSIKGSIDAITSYLSFVMGVYKAMFNGIATLWNSTIGKLSFNIPKWVPQLGGKGFDVPDIPMLAAGGIVTSPTLAMIGEGRGPEAVIPLDRMGDFGMGGGTTVNINVNGGDPNAVVAALRTYMRQNGSVPIKTSNAF